VGAGCGGGAGSFLRGLNNTVPSGCGGPCRQERGNLPFRGQGCGARLGAFFHCAAAATSFPQAAGGLALMYAMRRGRGCSLWVTEGGLGWFSLRGSFDFVLSKGWGPCRWGGAGNSRNPGRGAWRGRVLRWGGAHSVPSGGGALQCVTANFRARRRAVGEWRGNFVPAGVGVAGPRPGVARLAAQSGDRGWGKRRRRGCQARCRGVP